MLDRLLGLSDLRNILDGIKQAKLTTACDAADDKFNGIESKLNAIVMSKRADIQRYKNAATTKGADTSSFAEKGAERLCLGVKALLDQFAEQCGLKLPELPSPTNLEAQQRFSVSAKLAHRKLRDEQPDLKRQNALLERQSQLQPLQSAYSSQAREVLRLESARSQIEQKEGTRETMQARVDGELNPRLEAAKTKRTEIDKRAGVIEEAIKYFEATKDSATKSTCPVCDKEVPNATHLHAHLTEFRKVLKKELDPIQNEIGSVEGEIARLGGQIKEWDRLCGQINEQLGKVAQAKQGIQKELNRTIADTDDLNAIITSELARISSELGGIEEQVKKSNQRLNGIEDAIGVVDEVLNVLGLEAEIDGLLKIKESDEYKAVEKAKGDLHKLAADVDLVSATVAEVLQSNARDKLQTAKNAIAENFRKLANRPDFQEIEIDPETYDVIAVQAGEKISALSIFNQGDLNCAAVSIFLGLGTAQEVSHQLGFVILDDPSQSMDTTHRENLVKLLNTLPGDKQLIISTSESDFAQTIVRSVTRKKKHYRFDSWSEETGAQPKESLV